MLAPTDKQLKQNQFVSLIKWEKEQTEGNYVLVILGYFPVKGLPGIICLDRTYQLFSVR